MNLKWEKKNCEAKYQLKVPTLVYYKLSKNSGSYVIVMNGHNNREP